MRLVDATQLQKRVGRDIDMSDLPQEFYDGAMWVLEKVQKFRAHPNAKCVVYCKDCKHHTDCPILKKYKMTYCNLGEK